MGDIAPIIRISLRYISGYLVFKSIIPPDIADMLANDPELVAFFGVVVASVVEFFYVLAKKFGWAK